MQSIHTSARRRVLLSLMFGVGLSGLGSATAVANHDVIELVSRNATGATGGFLSYVTPDGEHVYFSTRAQVLPEDTDDVTDAYERSAGATTLASAGMINGNGPYHATLRVASDDGAKAFFESHEQLAPEDLDSQQDVYMRSGGVTTLMSIGLTGGNGQFSAGVSGISNIPFGRPRPGISPDGSRLFFMTNEPLVPEDTRCCDVVHLYERSGGTTKLVSAPNTTTFFEDVTEDGSVFFYTDTPLSPEDRDTAEDVYQRLPDGRVLLRSQGRGLTVENPVTFRGASRDGSHVMLQTYTSLVGEDQDHRSDVYENFAGSTRLVSTGPASHSAEVDAFPAKMSADGTRAFFYTDEPMVAADTDQCPGGFDGPGCVDFYERSGDTTTLVSTGPRSNGSYDVCVRFPCRFAFDVSADASRSFFQTPEPLVPEDTDSSVDVYERSGATTRLLSIGPSGGNGSFGALLPFPTEAGVTVDGSGVFFETQEQLVEADTDTSYDIYERFAGDTTLISANGASGNGPFNALFRGASLDGTRVFFETNEKLVENDTNALSDVYVAKAPARPMADLTVTKTDSRDPVSVGEPFTYTLTVKNDGPQRAIGAVATDLLPKVMRFRSVQSTQGGCEQHGTIVQCILGDIPAGESATMTITVSPNKTGSFTDTASVTDGAPEDPDTSNNSVSETTTVHR